MKILITGGADYIGSVLTPALLQAGHEVTVLDNFMFRQNSLTDCCRYDTFQIVREDCRDESVVKPLVAIADAVIPLAALVGAPLCDRDGLAAQPTNADVVRVLCLLTNRDQWVFLPTTNSGYKIREKWKYRTEETPLQPIPCTAQGR